MEVLACARQGAGRAADSYEESEGNTLINTS